MKKTSLLLIAALTALLGGCPGGTETEGESVVLLGIEITRTPLRIDYEEGDSQDVLDLTGLEVVAVYSDGKREVLNLEDVEIRGFNTSRAGSKNLDVVFEGKNASFTVMINSGGIKLEGITLESPPRLLDYRRNQELKLDGMALFANWDDGTKTTINHADLTLIYDTSEDGKKTVTVSYGGRTCTFGIMVSATVKVNVNGLPVSHVMWGEPEEDPRIVMGYQLDDGSGTAFFDRYCMLYGFRLVERDCANINTGANSWCNRTGLHICIMNRIQEHYIDRYDTYLKPLRDMGIKVIMSIVPQDGGVCIGTLYRWPNQADWNWEENYQVAEYDFNERAVARVLAQLKEIYDRCPFDGIGYDEEYGNLPGGSEGRHNVYAGNTRIGGENILRFAYDLNQTIGKELIHEVYEIRYGSAIPESYQHPDGTMLYRKDLIDYSYSTNYGGWSGGSAIGMPREKYGPNPIAIADVLGGPKPPPGTVAGGIQSKMYDHLNGNYGVVMYYCLRSRVEMTERFPNHFGPGSPPAEAYLSQISQILYGYNVTYTGVDYARLWYDWE